MNITSVEFHPEGSTQVVVLSFRDPKRLNPYNIVGLAGLDVEEIRPRSYSGSGSLGQKFQNLSPGKRDVVARIQLNPNFGTDQTYSSLRDDLYRMIQSSRTGMVQIQFKNGNTVLAAISGFISKFEAPIMVKIPEVQITFDCGDTVLRAMARTELDVTAINEADITVTDMVSTAHHGFIMNVNILDPLAEFRMYDPEDDSWEFLVAPVGGFQDNDILSFSSEHDSKHLLIIRGLGVIFLGDVLQPGSVWPVVFPGRPNKFAMDNAVSLALLDLDYYATYWGV